MLQLVREVDVREACAALKCTSFYDGQAGGQRHRGQVHTAPKGIGYQGRHAALHLHGEEGVFLNLAILLPVEASAIGGDGQFPVGWVKGITVTGDEVSVHDCTVFIYG